MIIKYKNEKEEWEEIYKYINKRRILCIFQLIENIFMTNYL